MKTCKRIATMLLCLLAFGIPLLSCIPTPAFAHAVPDISRKGSITVTMRNGEKPVSGGTLTLYRVGKVMEDDGNYSFLPTGKFTAWGADFGDIASASQSAKTAGSLADYVAKYKLTGTTKTIDKTGKVTFSDLEVGLYLLVQNKPAIGYNAVSPFLVSVPYLEDGEYIYNVTPNTKTELEKKPDPTKPSNPTTPSNPSTKLPQTGQLNWPIPVMAILGMTLFAIGWVLRFRKRDDNAQ